MYFHRLLVQPQYQDGEDLPGEIPKAIQRMRKEGRDPVESCKPGDRKNRKPWQSTVEQVRLTEELDPTPWPDMVALVKEMEARHPQLRNREVLIEELTARFVNALKANNLPALHSCDWYRTRIATLMSDPTHPFVYGNHLLSFVG